MSAIDCLDSSWELSKAIKGTFGSIYDQIISLVLGVAIRLLPIGEHNGRLVLTIESAKKNQSRPMYLPYSVPAYGKCVGLRLLHSQNFKTNYRRQKLNVHVHVLFLFQ